jgi:hypothetical protein
MSGREGEADVNFKLLLSRVGGAIYAIVFYLIALA